MSVELVVLDLSRPYTGDIDARIRALEGWYFCNQYRLKILASLFSPFGQERERKQAKNFMFTISCCCRNFF